MKLHPITPKVIIALALLSQPAAAQWLDRDGDWLAPDTYAHMAAGATVNVLVRGPWVAKGWRDTPAKRVAVTMLVGLTYEVVQAYHAKQHGKLGQKGYGISPKDLAADLLGALVVEGAVSVFRGRR